jgi:16S rRNA (adenine1518-N6/adenine1519-N6)-dimethyltransferase|tara:strand:+ start:6039 stop:6818 length:780 start_codon:yes stop_codon:yes gene_type:complete
MKAVSPKKKLGQHFLNDLNIAQKIADLLQHQNNDNILEMGPGMGVLTQFLIPRAKNLKLVEIDNESVAYLNRKYPELQKNTLNEDFLKMDLSKTFDGQTFDIIGNFPYNISSQIVFKALEYRQYLPFFCGMFQKEVAQRICEKPGTKAYGILSVLCQTYYHAQYHFNVSPAVFSPPPKVDSGVLSLKRKEDLIIDFDEKLLFKIVKTGFQQRRKTLRNSLKSLNIPKLTLEDSIFDLRPEKLSAAQFIELTKKVGNAKI